MYCTKSSQANEKGKRIENVHANNNHKEKKVPLKLTTTHYKQPST